MPTSDQITLELLYNLCDRTADDVRKMRELFTEQRIQVAKLPCSQHGDRITELLEERRSSGAWKVSVITGVVTAVSTGVVLYALFGRL
jgi:hypothetical protein